MQSGAEPIPVTEDNFAELSLVAETAPFQLKVVSGKTSICCQSVAQLVGLSCNRVRISKDIMCIRYLIIDRKYHKEKTCMLLDLTNVNGQHCLLAAGSDCNVNH